MTKRSAKEPRSTRLILPLDLYERLRRAAFETRQPMARIIKEGLRRELERLGGRGKRARRRR